MFCRNHNRNMPRIQSCLLSLIQVTTIILSTNLQMVSAWGNSDGSSIDKSVYGMSYQRDEWMYSSKTISMKYNGCVWGYVDDRENAGCMDDESEDGTTMWYMMANCRRAQVAYSVYASSGSTSCNNGDFKESLVTTSGVAEFAYILGYYGSNSPISGDDVEDFPMCEYDGYGYYLSVGCSDSNTFTIDKFYDAYCLQPVNEVYDSLSNFNSAMKSLSKCYNIYDSSNDESPYYAVSSYLISNSASCNEGDSPMCTSNSFVKDSGNSRGIMQRSSNKLSSGASLSFTNKVKYGLGTVMLLGSLIMFVGILLTNRRRRRALMHRRLRNKSSKGSKSGSKKKKKSSKGSTSGSRRSSSRKKEGVFT